MEEKVYMKGYKAFKPGLVCDPEGNRFQYAENTVFEMEESPVVCQRGFHFCKYPLDVLDYYPLINNDGTTNEFAQVEALDDCVTDDDKKYSTRKIRIGAKFGVKELVQAAVTFDYTSIKRKDGEVLANKKDCAQMASSGNCAKMASSGDYAQMASSGDYAQMASSGNCAKMASSGDYAKMASSGYSAKMASSGYSAQMASSGYSAQMASSGNCAKMASSGYSAKMASSGNCAKMASSGENAVVMCAGNDSKAKAKKGSWITLSEWYCVNGEYTPVCVKTERVDGERIKEDTWYKLCGGEFVEVQ